MHAGREALRRGVDGGINGELIAAGVHAELEVPGYSIDSVADGSHIEGHFAGELRDVADVVDAIIEAATEFRGNRLDGDLLIGDCAEDDEQAGGCLRGVGLVHRDFGNEVPFPFAASILR